MAIQVVILAAGLGKRMHSSLPKVLQPLAQKPLIHHVLDTVALMPSATPIVVYGHKGELLKKTLHQHQVRFVEQTSQLGTAHALLQALPELSNDDPVLVLYGDVPLISLPTLEKLIGATPKNAIGIITAQLNDPTGYGRIKRNAAKKITGIVEEKDASPKERKITEINTGIYLLPANFLRKVLPKIKNNNLQKEYYLPDVIKHAVNDRIKIVSVQPEALEEILGINDRVQLAQLERYYQAQYASKLMRKGVSIIDPSRLDVRGELQIGHDVTLDINVICEGRVTIGHHCYIGPNVILRDCIIGDHVCVKANSIIEGADIGNECIIGPFARIRPDTHLADAVHIGNFVEIKKSKVGVGTKINHLTYIGDSEIGSRVNIGAGTITCNYDGSNKHKTIIGNNVFVGSATQFVAPVTIGDEATIGAGSTITEDAPANQLTLARAKQVSIPNWQRPQKKSTIK